MRESYKKSIGKKNLLIGSLLLLLPIESLKAQDNASFQLNYFLSGGRENSAFGVQSLKRNTTGSGNSAIGRAALHENTTGNYNIIIGANAFLSNTTGSNNTIIGYESGVLSQGSCNVFIRKRCWL